MTCGNTVLTDALSAPPRIAAIRLDGAALDLSTIDLDPGASSDDGVLFRFDDAQWIYNLSTRR